MGAPDRRSIASDGRRPRRGRRGRSTSSTARLHVVMMPAARSPRRTPACSARAWSGTGPGLAPPRPRHASPRQGALIDPAGGALQEMGMLGIIGLLEGPTDVVPLPPIEWPMPSMELSFRAWHADCLARAGRIEHAAEALTLIAPSFVTDVDHDGYWLATLSMLADAAHLTGDASTGAAVWQALRSVTHLTIVDPRPHLSRISSARSRPRGDGVWPSPMPPSCCRSVSRSTSCTVLLG